MVSMVLEGQASCFILLTMKFPQNPTESLIRMMFEEHISFEVFHHFFTFEIYLANSQLVLSGFVQS